MRKTFILVVVLFSILRTGFSQQDSAKINKDYIVTGYCGINDIKNGKITSDWYIPGYSSYTPDNAVVEKLKPFTESNMTITIVLGTWCSDSQEQFPRFIKIIHAMGLDVENLNIICVDRQKKAEGINLESLKIEKVPTFIISRDEDEIGRIIETPETTLEKDLLNILNK
ncbi:MAG: hypothetical protein CVU05_05570 [Bacteroidetes bacterium HGW-Bacteroidetes-21]|jgi:hypothetical protein|nr:MAG: hypothetical protein CVU05_05570 [Bacteroidetes bacterium HGW-Bacteroidetes-21]